MKCPACGSEHQHVMSTRNAPAKVIRLRCCDACGHRWNTAEIPAQNLSLMESAADAVRSIANLTKELDAAATHG